MDGSGKYGKATSQPTLVCIGVTGVAIAVYTCCNRWWVYRENHSVSAAHGVVQLGRSGPVRILHMVAPKQGSKAKFLQGPAGQQIVAVEELDSERPLERQWVAAVNRASLTLFKLHSALAAPQKSHNAMFLAEIGDLYARHRSQLDEMSVVPLAGEKLLADRYEMMRLLEDVCCVVSGAFAKMSGNSGQNHPVCAVPVSQDIKFEDYSNDAFDTALLGNCFPLVIKPRDSSNHAQMALVFDQIGLDEFVQKLQADFRIEQFISHGGQVLKVFVLDSEIKIGIRKSLPNVSKAPTREQMIAFSKSIDGDYRSASPERGGMGHIEFDSAILTKGKNRNGDSLDAAKNVHDVKGLDPKVVRFIAEALAHRIGTRLLGFDMLICSDSPTVYVCDCNVFPGYKGVQNAEEKVRNHLVKRAADMAVKEDTEKLRQTDTIRRIAINALPTWEDQDNIVVEPISDHSNYVFKVLNLTAAKTGRARFVVIYRLFGRPFGPKGIIENQLARDLSVRKIGADWIGNIHACYFGKEIHLGRIEEMLQGLTLERALCKGHPFANLSCFWVMCACIGSKLASLHCILDHHEDHHVDRRSTFINLQFPHPRTPKAASRLQKWRLVAQHAMHISSLQKHRIWTSLFDGFNMLVAEIDEREKNCMAQLRTEEARATVFGHFDPNLSNLIVTAASETGQIGDVHLIDFEWAGPNIAVYDFAKFITSVRIKRRREQTFCVDELGLRQGMRSMTESYMDQLGRGNVGSATIDDLMNDIYLFIPIVAAVNFFSNIVHASKEGQLSTCVPSTKHIRFGDRDEHFNWLSHAEEHLRQYNLAVQHLESMPKINR